MTRRPLRAVLRSLRVERKAPLPLCFGAACAAMALPWGRHQQRSLVRCQQSQGLEGTEFRSLFPEVEARKTGMLETADGCSKIYYEVSGNPNGKVALFLHGGPGDGCSPKHRRLFDPEAFCIVTFDQRGAGQTRPSGFTEDNHTANLIEDIELLRKHLNLDRWDLLVGGSWGSTLALAYATKYHDTVKAMVLYSIFIPSKAAIEFVYSPQGAGLFFPEDYEAFVKAILPERTSPARVISCYAKRLTSPEASVRNAACAAYLRWVMRLLSLCPDENIIEEIASKPEDAGTGPAIEMNYMANGCFLDSQQLLDDCCRIAHIPCTILHGRNDLICPPVNAWTLRKYLPLANLKVVPMAGHSSSLAPALKSAILEAIDSYR